MKNFLELFFGGLFCLLVVAAIFKGCAVGNWYRLDRHILTVMDEQIAKNNRR